MSDLDLDALEAMEKAATKGPWHETRDGGTGCPQIHTYHAKTACGSPKPVLHAGFAYGPQDARGYCEMTDRPEVRMTDEDLALVLALRNAAPVLIAAARLAEAVDDADIPPKYHALLASYRALAEGRGA